MIENITRERLLEGETVLGCFVRSPDANFAEYVASWGWDFLVFDEEHGSIDRRDVPNLARACERRGVTPIVRVSSGDSALVLRCLDAGAAGLHFPWINDAEQARRAVSAAKYGPLGIRGLAGNRATDWSVTSEATARANENTLTVVQVETEEAVENIDDLCSIDGVDVLFVGPTDLSQSLGVPGEYAHPLVIEAMEKVADAVRESGKVFGLFAGTQEAALRGLEMGARYIATGVEAVVGRAMSSFIQAVSEESDSR